MARFVQKYGGIYVKNIDYIKNVTQRIKESYDTSNELIVDVSALDGVIDKLINDAKKYPTSLTNLSLMFYFISENKKQSRF